MQDEPADNTPKLSVKALAARINNKATNIAPVFPKPKEVISTSLAQNNNQSAGSSSINSVPTTQRLVTSGIKPSPAKCLHAGTTQTSEISRNLNMEMKSVLEARSLAKSVVPLGTTAPELIAPLNGNSHGEEMIDDFDLCDLDLDDSIGLIRSPSPPSTGQQAPHAPRLSSDKCVVCLLSVWKERPLNKLNCLHAICQNCLESVYTGAMAPRPKLGRPKELVMTCLHFENIPVYGEPITEKHRTHTLRRIPCPEKGCQGEIGSDMLADLDSFNIDVAERMDEFEDYTASLDTYRKCILNDLVCFEEYQPIHLFIQLGCEHFVHPSCLSSWLKSEIRKAHEAQNTCEPIVCYECKVTKKHCSCPMCSISRPDNRGHRITEAEVRGLTKDPTTQFSDSDLDAFNKVSALADFRANEGERCVQCLKCNFQCLTNEGMDEVCCFECEQLICCLCGRAVHKGIDCDQETERFIDNTGERNNLQTCPFCKKYWGLPVHCMHATCDKTFGGCGGEFCFPCAAPRTPTMVHGTWFHRPQCPYFNNICCDNNCIINNAERCVNDKYWPGPCGDCRKLESHWNKCQHSEWRPCEECRRKSEPKCLHFCSECRRQGRLCSRPDNPRGVGGQLKFRVFSREELDKAR